MNSLSGDPISSQNVSNPGIQPLSSQTELLMNKIFVKSRGFLVNIKKKCCIYYSLYSLLAKNIGFKIIVLSLAML